MGFQIVACLRVEMPMVTMKLNNHNYSSSGNMLLLDKENIS